MGQNTPRYQQSSRFLPYFMQSGLETLSLAFSTRPDLAATVSFPFPHACQLVDEQKLHQNGRCCAWEPFLGPYRRLDGAEVTQRRQTLANETGCYM